jgi:phosphate transport system permease protein
MVSPLATEVRFKTPRSTLIFDRVMTWVIKVGGLGVIIAVLTLLAFILWQILPLFAGAHVTALQTIRLPTGLTHGQVAVVGLDEWGEAPFVLGKTGYVILFSVDSQKPSLSVPIDLAAGEQLTAWHYDAHNQRLCLGTSRGNLLVYTVSYQPIFTDGHRHITGQLVKSLTCPGGNGQGPLLAVGFAKSTDSALAIALQRGDHGKNHVYITPFTLTQSLGGDETLTPDQRIDLSDQIEGDPALVVLDERAESALIATSIGTVHYFFKVGDAYQLRQKFRPFNDSADTRISSLDYLLGDVSLVITNPLGGNRIFSLFHKDHSTTRLFGQTKQFPPLPGPADSFASSARNKAFLVSSGSTLSLRYGTSAAIRWESKLDYTVSACAISSKYERLITLGSDDQLHLYTLDDAHPETGFSALFGKVWYEGADAPSYTWQSGGSEDFEPKLSMIPLLAGTLKGTFYAIIFAVPIALLGAIYTSEFMHPRFKSVIKPSVEIMASLPSVVLGFLAALWLAQLIANRVPSIILMLILVPSIAMLFGWLWANLPRHYRAMIPPGYEFIAFLPILIATVTLAWFLGPVLERLVFVVTDPVTHARVGDFPAWWRQTTNLNYEQGNSLVVGIMMGFAVIPIIFTIAEDALSNVPSMVRSGSLALGASRWQTAFRVVVPTASAGIFSALMIGLGRAIGETMIVVMATGNTAVMNMNIFDGMRTLSANIAVELSEAPEHSTLYHTLFLGAFLLFSMTFVINTAAEVLRQHLREKYKTV